jgi:two-component system chemotaxis sensor kinase CheA
MTNDALAARLLVIFTDELDEQVQQLNDDLLALERTPSDGERLRAVFRVMHTLKGASRAAGLPMVEELCHALENELSRVRDGGAPLGPAQIALLFEAADALGETRDKLRAGEPVPDTTLATVLSHARGRGSAAPLVRPPVVEEPVVPQQAIVPQEAVILSPSTALGVNSAKDLHVPQLPTPPTPTPDEPRASHVRVSLQQVDAIAGAAAELAGLAAVLGERADELGALRARRRAERRRDGSDDALDSELTRLLRRAGEDARAVTGVSVRLGASARHLRQRPLAELTETLPRIARDVALAVGKQVRVVIAGAEIEADRVVLEALREPLLHLVRNAIDHGLELPAQRTAVGKDAEGEVRIEGSLRGDRLQVMISDDGRGLDLVAVRRGVERRGRHAPDDPAVLVRAIFDDGFTTRETATTLSGRGVGMGIVRAAAERMGGTVEVTSIPNKGTKVTIDVPVSIATMSVVLVQVGGVTLGVPSAFVVRVGRADPRTLARVDGRTMLVTHDRPTPVTTLAALLGPPFEDAPPPAMMQLVVLESGGRRLAVVVDDLVDERELVLRPLEHAGAAATGITVGTALLGTGVVALVLSVPALIDQNDGSGESLHPAFAAAGAEPRAPSRVLVVDDSITSRTLEQSVLSAAGYDVTTAVDGAEAWRSIERHDFALVVSDVEMPHLDGFGLCERIRANPRTAALPVILVTSLDEPAQRARGLEAGADAYITKSSFDQDTLLDTVRMLIGRDG